MPLPIWPAPMTPILASRLVMVVAFSPAKAWPSKGALQFGKDLVKVADQTIVGNREDRRVRILVDGDDDLGFLHSGEVLDGAGNPDRDVELRGYHLAGL